MVVPYRITAVEHALTALPILIRFHGAAVFMDVWMHTAELFESGNGSRLLTSVLKFRG